jgi:hypothetical protein
MPTKGLQKAALVGLSALLGAALLGALGFTALRPSASRALASFYEHGAKPADFVTEDMQMDPLILAGDRVVPLVLRDITNPLMPKRRYAIGFLGNGGYREAKPALRRLLSDPGESAIFRGDALKAIAQIDPDEGRQLASTYAADPSVLGYSARAILAGGTRAPRGYVQALLGCHDC